MKHPEWTFLHKRARDLLGAIPFFLDENDPRPAAEQFDEAYAHGGGWRPLPGWKLDSNAHITYPGDETLAPVAYTRLRDEAIFVYPHAWVCVAKVGKPDEFAVSRMD